MQSSIYSPSRKQQQLFLRQKQEWQNWAAHMFVLIAQNSVNIFHLCEAQIPTKIMVCFLGNQYEMPRIRKLKETS